MSKPIIPWVGGKRRLAKRLLPLFPAHQCYVEPFCGAAALFFMKEPATAEVINDINGDLINLYRVARHHPDALIKEFEWVLASRQEFDGYKRMFDERLTDIQRAARFYYLQRSCFGGRVEAKNFGVSTTTPTRLQPRQIERDLRMAHSRLLNTTIEHMPWDACIERYDRPHTFFYCDPPYWGTEGYGVEFGLEQYDRLAEVAGSAKGKVLISVNDIPEMRRAFAGLSIDTVNLKYTVGGHNTDVTSRELIISNF